MSILINKNTRLLVQGITGNEGLFHTTQMFAYGTNVVSVRGHHASPRDVPVHAGMLRIVPNRDLVIDGPRQGYSLKRRDQRRFGEASLNQEQISG